jgi:hypothetical protein
MGYTSLWCDLKKEKACSPKIAGFLQLSGIMLKTCGAKNIKRNDSIT